MRNDDASRHLVDQLNEIRQARGFTFERLAILAGISKSTLVRIFRHENAPSLETAERIANAMGYIFNLIIKRKRGS